ncbi:putative outer membrane cation efflux protein [Vibrio ichthyoenteri ATCC 700023]|uniref:Putative outer membrane cation efflux protein n=1 Tax=Vibrio ichthyoenteri ATCC 700023 TaxID=870968 RepID=F9RXF9_9VIBR|nr:TolC family protein [Vibrio ichthyoenteri]EGU48055.1 putative outer membrane cation efflux protein [Vibrio ichthyoenteri ATCC 700023]
MKFHLNLVTIAFATAMGTITPVLANEFHSQAVSIEQKATSSPTATLTLEQLIEIAIENDATRRQFIELSNASLNSGLAKATLADPTIKVGFGGVPIDSFQLDQDPMSNISLGVMQKFDRGDTTTYQAQQAQNQAQIGLSQANLRAREVAMQVTTLWLELGYNRTAQQLLQQQQLWLTQWVDSLDSNYALGLSESQDVIGAQLKVSQIEQKLLSNQQTQHQILAQLSEWFSNADPQANPLSAQDILASNHADWSNLEAILDTIDHSNARYDRLRLHPTLQALEASILAAKSQVAIAEETYSPQFGIELMYAHRQANNMQGEPAPDMLSAYLTVDLPLFTGNKQDKAHAGAQYQVGALQAQRDALLAKLNSQLNSLLSTRQFNLERIERYRLSLLKQAKSQRLAVEQGYQNNSANFGDIVTTSTNQLTIELEYQRLITDLNITNNQLANLLSSVDIQLAQSSTHSANR